MAFILCLNLLFILFNIIKATSYIIIPFEVQNYYKEKINDKKIIDKYLYKDIIVKFFVGNPSQDVKLSVCLGEYTTFIISNDANGYEGGTYNKSLSKSYYSLLENEKPQYYTFQTFSEGILSRENFIINKTKTELNNLKFILATEIGGNNCYSTYCETLMQPGILGFQLAQSFMQVEEDTNLSNFISQLKEKELISDYYFYFDFDSDNSGKIIIGLKPNEYDSSYYKNKHFLSTKVSIDSKNNIDWSVMFDKIHYGETELYSEKSLLLRIEFGLIKGYYEWEKIVKNDFFDKLIEEKKCFKNYTNEFGSTAYFYYCNKNVNISTFKPFIFTINEFEYNFILDKDDLFIETEDKYLFLMIFSGISDMILGYPFLKKYQLIFNQDSKTIGFYVENKDFKDFWNNSFYYYIAIGVLGIILVILIAIGINIYLKKKKSKKLATELLNDESIDTIENKGNIIN